MTERDDVYTGLDGFTDKDRELENYLHTLVLNDSTIIDALARILGLISKLDEREKQHHKFLDAEVRSLTAMVADQAFATRQGAPVVAPTAEAFSTQNPEISLLQYVSSYVANRTAVDFGADAGDVAERLLDCGCQVYAFEPF